MYAFVSWVWGLYGEEGDCIVLLFRQLIWTLDETELLAFELTCQMP